MIYEQEQSSGPKEQAHDRERNQDRGQPFIDELPRLDAWVLRER
jgi:hypothetical protein